MFHTVRQVLVVLSPFGVVTHLGNSLLNAWSGITLPPVLVSILHLSVACWLDPISVGIRTVAHASVVVSGCVQDQCLPYVQLVTHIVEVDIAKLQLHQGSMDDIIYFLG